MESLSRLLPQSVGELVPDCWQRTLCEPENSWLREVMSYCCHPIFSHIFHYALEKCSNSSQSIDHSHSDFARSILSMNIAMKPVQLICRLTSVWMLARPKNSSKQSGAWISLPLMIMWRIHVNSCDVHKSRFIEKNTGSRLLSKSHSLWNLGVWSSRMNQRSTGDSPVNYRVHAWYFLNWVELSELSR